MAPALSTAYTKRWWLAITSVVENLMFAAVLLGWSSLLLMLKNEGFYAHLCYVTNETLSQPGTENQTESLDVTPIYASPNATEDEIFPHVHSHGSAVRFTPSGYPTCSDQDELLNRYFSIGSSLLSGVTIVLGVIMDIYGSRMIRLCGTWAFMTSCILFALGSLDPLNFSIMIAPAVCLNGMGGVAYVFTSFPIPNLFENLRSTMIALMIGSYSASAIMYMLFKAAYDAGVPFVALMVFHAILGFLTFLKCYFYIPGQPIPGPDDLSYAIKLRHGTFQFEHKVSGKKFLQMTSSVGRRMSSVTTTQAENHNYLTSVPDLKLDKAKTTSANQEMSFLKVVITPCVLWSFVTICITQLRLIAYMGWLELYFRSSCHHKGFDEEKTTETVEFYTFIFGLLQINCFFMAPIIGTILDWNLKSKNKKKAEKKNQIVISEGNGSTNGRVANADAVDSENGQLIHSNGVNGSHKQSEKRRGSKKKKKSNSSELNKRKIQQITNIMRAFLLTNTLQILFGVIILFEDQLEIQILAFIIHTAIRTFLHSSLGGLYACMYHFSLFGKLTGVSSFLSAMFILVGDPLFVTINSAFGGDPFWINFALLMCSVSGFGLPIYLWIHRRRLFKQKDDEAKELFTINEEEDGTSDEEAAPYVSSMALAL